MTMYKSIVRMLVQLCWAYFLKGAVCILVGTLNSGDDVSFASVSKGEYFLEEDTKKK